MRVRNLAIGILCLICRQRTRTRERSDALLTYRTAVPLEAHLLPCLPGKDRKWTTVQERIITYLAAGIPPFPDTCD